MIDRKEYEGLIEQIDRIINAEETGVDDLLADCMLLRLAIIELLSEFNRVREGIADIVEEMQTWTEDQVGKPLFKMFIYELKEVIE